MTLGTLKAQAALALGLLVVLSQSVSAQTVGNKISSRSGIDFDRVSIPQTPSSNDKADWQARVERASQRKATGRNLLIGGGVFMALGGAMFIKSCGGGSFLPCRRYVAGGLSVYGGGALAVVGLIKWTGARSDLGLLNQDGKAKGYLTIAPTARGAVAAFSWAF